jgi:signal transduction histidine kinase
VDPGGPGGQFDRVRVALEAARAEAQAAVHALRTGFDAGTSLQEELPRRLDAFIERTGFRVSLELDARVDIRGVPAAEVVRVVDEALRNAEKHADATAIRVRVIATSEGASIAVEDNGHGFEPGEPTAGHGLLGMRERASLLGGELMVRSAPGDGTHVELVVPSGSGLR